MPMGEYSSFEDCVRKNSGKDDPNAYCATIMRAIEGKAEKADYAENSVHKALGLEKADEEIDVSKLSSAEVERRIHDYARMGYEVHLESRGEKTVLVLQKARPIDKSALAKAWKAAKECRKSGIASIPADQKKSIDSEMHGYDPKMVRKAAKDMLAKAWKANKAEDPEYAKERAEHPNFTDEQIRQIIEDHRKGEKKEAQFSKQMAGAQIPEHHTAQLGLAMKDYAVLEARFLKEGDFPGRSGGVYHYDWDTIQKFKDTYKGKEFYINHNEGVGVEYGIIDDVTTKTIDGVNWLVAKIKVPETDFTKDFLARIENGLIKSVSSTHAFYVDPNDPGRKVLRISGQALSTVREPEVEGAQILNLQRNLHAG